MSAALALPTQEVHQFTLEEQREFLKCRRSQAYFIDTYCQIQSSEYGTAPFHLWDWQYDLLDAFAAERLLIILKARQLGVTELALGYALHLIRFTPSTDVLVLSKKEQPDAQDMIARVRFMNEHLPDWLRVQEKVPAIDGARLGKDNESVFQIIHTDKSGRTHPSKITSLSATKESGRSLRGKLVILDEWAFQFYAEYIWGGIKPTAEFGQIIGISTANGLGNFFHRMWEQTQKRENTFYPVFLPWHLRPGRDQAWYERETKDMPKWLVHQEYPANPSEAFIQTGRPVFPPEVIDAHAERLEAEKPFAWEDEPGLTIYEWPVYDLATQDTTDYLIAADVAEGLEHGDYDAAVVLNRATGAEVAELHGHWSPQVFAAKLDKLGHFYHQAKLAVERNNHGHAVILALQSGLAHQQWAGEGEQDAYPNLYFHQDVSDRDGNEARKPGWVTTSVTKPLMLDTLELGLREMSYHTRSRIFLSEAKIFAHLDGGGMGAPHGYHDDTVICRAIAWFIFTNVLYRRRVRAWIPNLARTRGEDE